DGSGMREFQGIVGEIFQRRTQAQDVTRHHGGKVAGNSCFSFYVLVVGAGRKRGTDGFGESARREPLVTRDETFGPRSSAVDDQGRKGSHVISPAFDRIGPLALARAQVTGGQQFGQRDEPGEWRTNVVRDARESIFDRASLGRRTLCATRSRARPFAKLGRSPAFRHSLVPGANNATEAALNRARPIGGCRPE